MIGSIIVNDKSWSINELVSLSRYLMESSSDWQKSAGDFITNWISDDEFITVHTSGSTGQRKSIQLPKSMMRRSAQITANHFQLSKGSSALLCLSADYIAGKMMIVRALVNDWNLTLVEPNSNPLVDLSRHFDFCAMVPMQVQRTMASAPEKLQDIRTLIIGGAPISDNLVALLKTNEIKAVATYGMTETATHIAVKSLSPKADENFKTLPDYQISQDDRGCLAVNAPHLSGPVQTNDVVTLLDNSFVLKGRIDHVINSGGIKVFPQEIERILAGLFGDRTFYITSTEHESLGEKVTLVIEGDFAGDADLLEKCANIIDDHRRPRRVVHEVLIARTETGKIIRKKYS
jgi:O-succinylbenzoic acid--CoA ligase